MVTDWPGRTEQRITDLAGSSKQTRHRVTRWFTTHRDDPLFARFAGHFDAIEDLVRDLVDRLDRELDLIAPRSDSGAAYDRCRQLEEGLLVVRRLFDWYASRYDQRLDDELASVLGAADELVRSCWIEPFTVLHRRAPAGPLVFIDHRWGACANLRTSVPIDLRGPADGALSDLLGQLPVPTVALPPAAVRGAWWLVLAAHETGHHVQHDVPSLVTATRQALHAAAAPVDPGLIGPWMAWAAEVFADVFATLMVGGSAAWGIDELEHGPPARMARQPQVTDRYPPPAVRLALIGEIVAQLSIGDWPADAQGVRQWLGASPPSAVKATARENVDAHLAVVPQIAAALLDMPVAPAGTPGLRLRDLASLNTGWFVPGGRVSAWTNRLQHADSVLFPLDNRFAARLALAAGVEAYRATRLRPADDDRLGRLHRNMLVALRGSGAPGVLAPSASVGSTDELAKRFGDRLFGTPDPRTPDPRTPDPGRAADAGRTEG